MSEAAQLAILKDALRSYPDFPKKGIVFQDVFSLLRDPPVMAALLQLLEQRVRRHCPAVEAFVGLDARGFLFGLSLAMAFNKPFIPIRKKGKLPGPTEAVAYQLEYGEDMFEIQTDSLSDGQTVVVVDDLLATGGTLKAANELLKKLGVRVGLNLLCIELTDLNGRDKLDTPVQALLML